MPNTLVTDWITGLRSATNPVVSPPGDRVAYLVSGDDRTTFKATQHLVVLDLETGSERTLAADLEAITSLAWHPGGDSLLVAGTDSDSGQSGIWAADLTNDAVTLVVETVAPVSDLVASPTGTHLAWTRRVAPEAEPPGDPNLEPVRVIRRPDYKEDGTGLPNESHLQIEVFDRYAKLATLLTNAPFDYGALSFSPDGKHLGALERTRVGLTSRLWIHDLEGNVCQHLTDRDRVVRAWSWEPSGSGVVHISSHHPEINGDLFRIGLSTGSERRLTDRWDPCLDFGTQVISWLTPETLVIGGLETGQSVIWTIDAHSGAITRAWQGETMDHGLSVVPGHPQVVRSRNSATTSGELVLLDLTTQAEQLLTNLNTDLLQAHISATIEEFVADNEGRPVPYLLKRPATFDPERRYPVVFELHGGPHFLRGFAIEVSNQLLIESGYLVVCPNPRGSVSWPRDHAEGVWGDWGGGDWNDIMAVVDEVASMPYVDEKRIGVYGYSYGGYLASWAIGQTDRFQAAVIGAPLTNLVSRIGTADIGYLATEQEYMGVLPGIRDRLLRQSPVWYMHQATTPALILHPEEDQRCPVEQSEQLFEGLLRAGVITEFVRYPGQSHDMPWTGPAAYRIDYYTRLLEWFDQFLQPG